MVNRFGFTCNRLNSYNSNCKRKEHPVYVLFNLLSIHSNFKIGEPLGKLVMAISFYRIMVMS
jgi:hypothetical protein